MFDLAIIRAVFVAVLAGASGYLRPFGLEPVAAAGLGLIVSLAIIYLEIRLKRASLARLIGATAGALAGLLCAFLVGLVIERSFLQVVVVLVLGYVGLMVGASKGDLLNLGALGGLFGGDNGIGRTYKLLDTSVIIDGRIADICETGFLDGIMVIPQFVLRELQLVADSSDSMKRNRGRRGLDILQRIQKMAHLKVEIVEDDFPNIRDVDLKLIELARRHEAKIVTNDFNLNKLAQLQGVPVLNINELANALKPIVLPGEIMRVFILKEGKEYNQGVAYLDDGTMVVVDNAKKMISRTIDISVTSVLQTTAGKMIFGKYDERAHGGAQQQQQAGPGAQESGGGPRSRPQPAPREGQREVQGPARPAQPEPQGAGAAAAVSTAARVTEPV